MNKKILMVGAAALSTALYFTACGDSDSASATDEIPDYDTLPEDCTEGELAQVDDTTYTCVDGKWEVQESDDSTSVSSSSGSKEEKSSSSTAKEDPASDSSEKSDDVSSSSNETPASSSSETPASSSSEEFDLDKVKLDVTKTTLYQKESAVVTISGATACTYDGFDTVTGTDCAFTITNQRAVKADSTVTLSLNSLTVDEKTYVKGTDFNKDIAAKITLHGNFGRNLGFGFLDSAVSWRSETTAYYNPSDIEALVAIVKKGGTKSTKYNCDGSELPITCTHTLTVEDGNGSLVSKKVYTVTFLSETDGETGANLEVKLEQVKE